VPAHDRRPERLGAETSTSLAAVRGITVGLDQAARGAEQELIARVKASA
jgi:hypothetical protein